MKFNLNDTVAVINQNKIGVIVETFTAPKEGYLVEFCNDKGETVETLPFYPQDLKFDFSKITTKNISHIIKKQSQAIKALGVEELHLFGSYANGKATDKSDIDFAVKLVPEAKSILDFINVKFFLEDTFDCAIDLAPLENLHPALKSSISTSLIRVL